MHKISKQNKTFGIESFLVSICTPLVLTSTDHSCFILVALKSVWRTKEGIQQLNCNLKAIGYLQVMI